MVAAETGSGVHARQPGRHQARNGPKQPTSVKTGACAWINSQIVEASDAGGLSCLISTIEAHLSRMNLVNLTTSIHRLAKLSASDESAQQVLQDHPIIESLRKAISVALVSMAIDRTLPQTLSNVAWSLATLRCFDRVLLELVASKAIMTMHFFKPFELSSLLWAFAKIGHGDIMTCLKPLFQSANMQIIEAVKDMRFGCLATCAWAYATTKQPCRLLFRSMADQMRQLAPSANCQEMANTVWAFATVFHHDEALFFTIAETAVKHLSKFKSQELVNMMWGFANADFFHDAFFTKALSVMQHLHMNAQHFANVLWACARLKPQHPATKQAVLVFLPRCISILATFKPQEVSSVAMALAKVFEFEDQCKDAGSCIVMSGPQAHQLLHPDVLAFFAAVSPHILANLRSYSVESLSNMACALTKLDMGASVLPAMEHEVLYRIGSLAPSVMCCLLRAFLSTPGASSRQTVPALAAELVKNWPRLRQSDRRVLMFARAVQQQSSICEATSLDGEAKTGSGGLQKWCLALASSGSGSLLADAPERQLPVSLSVGCNLETASEFSTDGSDDGGNIQECKVGSDESAESVLTDDELPYATWDAMRGTSAAPDRGISHATVCLSASGYAENQDWTTYGFPGLDHVACVQGPQTLSLDALTLLGKPSQCSLKKSFLHTWADEEEGYQEEHSALVLSTFRSKEALTEDFACGYHLMNQQHIHHLEQLANSQYVDQQQQRPQAARRPLVGTRDAPTAVGGYRTCKVQPKAISTASTCSSDSSDSNCGRGT